MISIISSICLLIVVLSSCQGTSPSYEKCSDDNVQFAAKVDNSSFVVYGKPVGKMLDVGSDTTFHVSFQVDCIFKGTVLPRIINITQAGLVNGKRFCQDFSVGHGRTVAFLEPRPLNSNDSITFIPADFIEVLVKDNSTYELLENTCNLQRLLPMNYSGDAIDACPAVSTDVKCHYTTTRSHLEDSTIEPGVFPHGIRGKSAQIDVDRNHGSLNMNTNVFLILLMFILVVRLN